MGYAMWGSESPRSSRWVAAGVASAGIAVLAGCTAVPPGGQVRVQPPVVTAPASPTADPSQTPTPSATVPTPSATATAAPAPATSSAPAVAPTPPPAAADSALAAVDLLEVKGRAPKTGYSRGLFGAWSDLDGNGCDTRSDVLRQVVRGGSPSPSDPACDVVGGTIWDPYLGAEIPFVSSKIDVDHVVALSDAWQKGAQGWPAAQLVRFGNDPLNLLAVTDSLNSAKGDSDAASWLPPNKAYRCDMVARQVAVKVKYGLWVTAAEREAMIRVLSACPTMPLPG